MPARLGWPRAPQRRLLCPLLSSPGLSIYFAFFVAREREGERTRFRDLCPRSLPEDIYALKWRAKICRMESGMPKGDNALLGKWRLSMNDDCV